MLRPEHAAAFFKNALLHLQRVLPATDPMISGREVVKRRECGRLIRTKHRQIMIARPFKQRNRVVIEPKCVISPAECFLQLYTACWLTAKIGIELARGAIERFGDRDGAAVARRVGALENLGQKCGNRLSL